MHRRPLLRPPYPSLLPCRALEPLTFPVLARSLNRANMARLNAFPPLLPSPLSCWRPAWQVCSLARSLVAVAMQTPLSVVEVEGSAQDRGRTPPWDNVLEARICSSLQNGTTPKEPPAASIPNVRTSSKELKHDLLLGSSYLVDLPIA